MGPIPASTVLTAAEEALAVTFRQHTLLPLDDCLYALQATIPHLSRSALHCCFSVMASAACPCRTKTVRPRRKRSSTTTLLAT